MDHDYSIHLWKSLESSSFPQSACSCLFGYCEQLRTQHGRILCQQLISLKINCCSIIFKWSRSSESVPWLDLDLVLQHLTESISVPGTTLIPCGCMITRYVYSTTVCTTCSCSSLIPNTFFDSCIHSHSLQQNTVQTWRQWKSSNCSPCYKQYTSLKPLHRIMPILEVKAYYSILALHQLQHPHQYTYQSLQNPLTYTSKMKTWPKKNAKPQSKKQPKPWHNSPTDTSKTQTPNTAPIYPSLPSS